MKATLAAMMAAAIALFAGCEFGEGVDPSMDEVGTIQAGFEISSSGPSLCPQAHLLQCGQKYTIHYPFPDEVGKIERYQCMATGPFAGPKNMTALYKAPESIFAPIAPTGTVFSLHILTPNTPFRAFLLHGSCDPIPGTKQVKAYDPTKSGSNNGTCAAVNRYGVSGIAGVDFAVLDAMFSDTDVVVRMDCLVPPPFSATSLP